VPPPSPSSNQRVDVTIAAPVVAEENGDNHSTDSSTATLVGEMGRAGGRCASVSTDSAVLLSSHNHIDLISSIDGSSPPDFTVSSSLRLVRMRSHSNDLQCCRRLPLLSVLKVMCPL
jgi:hypothetical protein